MTEVITVVLEQGRSLVVVSEPVISVVEVSTFVAPSSPLSIYPRNGNQSITSGTTFSEDNVWRFDITPPYQYFFRFSTFLRRMGVDGATEARLGISLPANCEAFVDEQGNDEAIELDDDTNFIAFPLSLDPDVKTPTQMRSGFIDVQEAGEAVFLWKASDAGSFTITQYGVMEVYATVD